MNPNQKRVQQIQSNGQGGFKNSRSLSDKNILIKKSRKMPYSMLQGMQKKTKERLDNQKEHDKQLGIVGETHRSQKLMQTYFEKKIWQKKEEKRLHLNTDRGINFHRHTDLKYKNGALTLSKDKINKYASDHFRERPEISTFSQEIKKKHKWTHDEIKQRREENPEFATSKRFKKAKGSAKSFIKKKGKKKK